MRVAREDALSVRVYCRPRTALARRGQVERARPAEDDGHAAPAPAAAPYMTKPLVELYGGYMVVLKIS